MSEPILKAEHLGITFGGLKAVSDFNMTINAGELVGLIGPNGAGKTTVFNLLTGVYQPTEGEFFLDGERMNGKKTYQVVRAGIARTFQNIRLFDQMTVEETCLWRSTNLHLPAGRCDLPHADLLEAGTRHACQSHRPAAYFRTGRIGRNRSRESAVWSAT